MWLSDSVINIKNGGKMVKPNEYEISGSIKDRQLGGPQRARMQMKQHGKIVILDQYEFTLIRIRNNNGMENNIYDENYNSEIISEIELRWMIDMCGGTVINTIYHDQLLLPMSNSVVIQERKYHIYLMTTINSIKLEKLSQLVKCMEGSNGKITNQSMRHSRNSSSSSGSSSSSSSSGSSSSSSNSNSVYKSSNNGTDVKSIISLFWLLDAISNQETPDYNDLEPFVLCKI
jgi:hypothetical protein